MWILLIDRSGCSLQAFPGNTEVSRISHAFLLKQLLGICQINKNLIVLCPPAADRACYRDLLLISRHCVLQRQHRSDLVPQLLG
ncbi:hypothetical protein D3C75_1219400 [compost metagenome]